MKQTISKKYFSESMDSLDLDKIFKLFSWILILGRMAILITQFPAYVGGDTISYRPIFPAPTSIPLNTYWPQTLWGNSTRGLLTVGFYHFLPSDELRMVGQSIVSLFAWWYFGKVLKSLSIRFSLSILKLVSLLATLAVFALSPEVTSWNKILYSESLAISFFIMSLGLLCQHLFGKHKMKYFLFLIITDFLLITARPDFLFYAMATFTALSLIAFRGKSRIKFTYAILSSILVSSSIAYVIVNDNYWAKNLWSRQLVSISYYSSQDNPHAQSFIQLMDADQSRPICVPKLTQPLTSNQELVWSLPFNFKRTCPAARSWSEKRFLPLLFQWWLKHPLDALDTYRHAFISSLRELPLFDQLSPLPTFAHDLFFPNVNNQVMYPDAYNNAPDAQPRFFFDPLLLILVFMSYFMFNWIKSPRKKQDFPQKIIVSFTAISLVLFITWILGIILIPGPPREVFRISVVPQIGLRLCSSLVLIFLIFEAKQLSRLRHLFLKRS
jgi:hypothetical protein